MARVPRYLHLPPQILWFDTEDLAAIAGCYLAWLMFSSWVILPFAVLVPFFFIRTKQRRPRGFLRHKLYSLGFASLKGYPPAHVRSFRE
jgi:hypothetical protein